MTANALRKEVVRWWAFHDLRVCEVIYVFWMNDGLYVMLIDHLLLNMMSSVACAQGIETVGHVCRRDAIHPVEDARIEPLLVPCGLHDDPYESPS